MSCISFTRFYSVLPLAMSTSQLRIRVVLNMRIEVVNMGEVRKGLRGNIKVASNRNLFDINFKYLADSTTS